MKVYETTIRPIPRQAIMGFMSLGIIEEDGDYYVLQLEPTESSVFVRVIQFTKMKRSDDVLDGDTSELFSDEIAKAIEQFAVEREVLTDKRVEIAIRKAAALSKQLTPPTFHHQYPCLMYNEKIAYWDMQGRKGMAPQQMVSTVDCWRCSKGYRDPCISKLLKYEEEDGPDRYVADTEADPKG